MQSSPSYTKDSSGVRSFLLSWSNDCLRWWRLSSQSEWMWCVHDQWTLLLNLSCQLGPVGGLLSVEERGHLILIDLSYRSAAIAFILQSPFNLLQSLNSIQNDGLQLSVWSMLLGIPSVGVPRTAQLFSKVSQPRVPA